MAVSKFQNHSHEGDRLTVPQLAEYLQISIHEAGVAPQQNLSEARELVRVGQVSDLLLNWYAKKERRSTYDVSEKIEKKNGLRVWFGNMSCTYRGRTGGLRWELRENNSTPERGGSTPDDANRACGAGEVVPTTGEAGEARHRSPGRHVRGG